MKAKLASAFGVMARLMLIPIFLLGITAQIGTAGEVGPKQSLDGTAVKLDQSGAAKNEIVVRLGGEFNPARLYEDSLPFEVIDSMQHSAIYLLRTDSDMEWNAVDSVLYILDGNSQTQPNYPLSKVHPVQGSYPFSDAQHIGSYKQQLAASLLELSNCHALVDGSGTKVAVIDAGVDFGHPGLEGAALSGYDYIDDDNYAFDEPGGIVSGHGTFVAGIIHLAAPGAQIISYRVADAAGDGDGFTLARAIEQAVDDGSDIINISLVLTEEHLAVREALIYAVSQGVLVVAAAGNESDQQAVFPAADPNALAVAAIDSQLVLADYSCYGPVIDICAPGSWVYSPYQSELYAWWSGTSFATPFVAGEAALLVQRAPQISLPILRSAIMSTGINLDFQNPGKDGLMGTGLVNPLGAIAAVDAAMDLCDTPGDINNNGIAYEMADMVWLDSAVTTGDEFFLGPKIGNGDIDGDCDIDGADLGLMGDIVTGEGIPIIAECAACSSYVLIPDTSGSPSDSAIFIPDQLVFQVDPGCWDTLTATVLLISSNAPATYHRLPTYGSDFMIINDTIGTTPDSIDIFVVPKGRGTGVWGEDVYYSVSGVPNYAHMHVTMIVGGGSPLCDLPGDVNANAIPYEYVDLALLDSALATGSTFYLEPKIGNADLTGNCLIDSVDRHILWLAIMGDTMPVLGCGPCSSYILVPDTIINPEDDSAYVYGLPGNFYAQAGSGIIQSGNLMIGATGESKFFSVSYLDNPEFIVLADSIGFTNDSVGFEVHSASLPPGLYVDSLIVYVDSVINSPLISTISLRVDSVSGGNELCDMPGDVNANAIPFEYADLALLDSALLTGDTMYLGPKIGNADLTGDCIINADDSLLMWLIIVGDTMLYLECGPCSSYILQADTVIIPDDDSAFVYAMPATFSAVFGTEITQRGELMVGATGEPKFFFVSCLDNPEFITLQDSVGITNDSIGFEVHSAGLFPGAYVDTLLIQVDSVNNSPLRQVIYLYITDDSGGTTDSALAIPDEVLIQVPYGNSDSLYRSVLIYSSNAPAAYTAFVAGGEQSFVFLPFPTGTTNDSLVFMIFPAGLNAGWYTDSILVDVAGCAAPARVIVNLQITGADSNISNLGLSNSPNPFNPVTDVFYSLPFNSEMTLEVFDLLGRKVITLAEGFRTAGQYRVTWNAQDEQGNRVSSGIYFYRLRANGVSLTRKMLLLR